MNEINQRKNSQHVKLQTASSNLWYIRHFLGEITSFFVPEYKLGLEYNVRD